MSKSRRRRAALTLAAAAVTILCVPIPAGATVISELRVRGPNGANDEFVELYNNTDAPVTVATADGSAGWAVATSSGVRFTVPNGTILPARGHYLGVNSVGYSLAAAATGDATYTTDIPDNAGVALFKTATPANFTLANRLDAIGSSSEASTLFKDGTGYSALTPFSIDYSFTRDILHGFPATSGSNTADLLFVDTNGTSAGAGQRLGAPGPQNLASPRYAAPPLDVTLVDPDASATAAPNFARDFTSDPANNATYGRVTLRRRITNTGEATLTALQLRIADVTTFPAPSGIADLRPQTSTSTSLGGGLAVSGTTLAQPPSQLNGGGFNSVLRVIGVSAGTPLPPGASINVQVQFGIQQNGQFRFCAQAEATPGANGIVAQVGTTDGSATVATQKCAPGYGLSAAGTTFGDQAVGTTAASHAVRVTNGSGSPITVGHPTLEGAGAGDFVLDDAACAGVAIAPGAGCDVGVRFTPKATGTRTATLRIPSTLPDVTTVVTGTAVPGAPVATPPTATPTPIPPVVTVLKPVVKAAACTARKTAKGATRITCRLTVKTGARVQLKLRGKVVATATVKRGARSVTFAVRKGRQVRAGRYTLVTTRGKTHTTQAATLTRR